MLSDLESRVLSLVDEDEVIRWTQEQDLILETTLGQLRKHTSSIQTE